MVMKLCPAVATVMRLVESMLEGTSERDCA
jgi:hypothetical protein